MIVQGRYIGESCYNYQGTNIIHNRIYPIEIIPNQRGYNWVVYIYDSFAPYTKIKAWIPYDRYPDRYWVTNTGIDYSKIHLESMRPLRPICCPRGCW